MGAIKKNIMIFLFLLFSVLVTSCTQTSLNSNESPDIAFSIIKPRSAEPDEVWIDLKRINGNNEEQSNSQNWEFGNSMTFDNLSEGEYDIFVYGKKGGFTILEGNEGVYINPGEKSYVKVNLNVLLRSEFIDDAQENQFTNNMGSESQFWEGISENGAAIFKLDDGNLRISGRSAWGNRGIYFTFIVYDKIFNELGISKEAGDFGEWLNDALIIYLSSSTSVNEVVDGGGFLDGFYRIMVEMGNSDISNSLVKIEGYINKNNFQGIESAIKDINISQFNAKMIQISPDTRIIEIFLARELFDKNINNQPKIAAAFKYRNLGNNNFERNTLGWKSDAEAGIENNIGQWGNIKLVMGR